MSGFQRVDFRNIVPRNGSQQAAFEEFCCQVARREPGLPADSEFVRYRGDGGDGGVECVWRLPSGQELGWQAKFVFDLPKLKREVDESLATALQIHKKLSQYTVCIPFDPTGPTARKGKSQAERLREYRRAWEANARGRRIKLKVVIEACSNLIDAMLAFDSKGGRLRYWFDQTILDDSWFRTHLNQAKATAGPRYTPAVRIQTAINGAFEAFGETDEWFASLANQMVALQSLVGRWGSCVRSKADALWTASFPEELASSGRAAHSLLAEITEQYRRIATNRKTEIDLDKLAVRTQQATVQFRELRANLRADLEQKHGPGVVDSASWRQFAAEYENSFPAANYDTSDEIVRFLEAFEQWTTAPVAKLPAASALLLLGPAGVGKTHSACDIAEIRASRQLRTIVMFGEQFSNAADPWEQIRLRLGFAAGMNRGAILECLDAAGEASGKPLLLFIDGLNETRPRSFWRAHLAALAADVMEYAWIKLCVSCRTTYKDQVLPAAPPFATIFHEGFKGIEFDACREFCAHYGLEPPTTPVLAPEFSNPLFLRLVCEAAKTTGHKRLPRGWIGISSAVQAFIGSKNARYAAEHDTIFERRLPEKALGQFVAACARVRRSTLSFEQTHDALQEIPGETVSAASLIDWLVREGLLIVDADPTGRSSDDHVRVAFERLGDHLLAAKLLENVQSSELQEKLSFLASSPDALIEHGGLIEALAVQIPERYEGIELPDCMQPLQDHFIKILVKALPWRDPDRLTSRTALFLAKSLSLQDFAADAVSMALSISTSCSPVDAMWLHDTLAAAAMPDRDSFWCGYLHESYEARGVVHRLIGAAFTVRTTDVPAEVVERWAVVLVWFCAAADRRIRDSATKALVRITECTSTVWPRIIERFAGIDDDFAFERCLAGAYGNLLRTRDKTAERAVACAVYQQVFAHPDRAQNAAIRDYGRSLLELAAHDDALPEGIGATDYLPPYSSEWPLQVPTDREPAPCKDSIALGRLYRSCTDDDFNTYTLHRLRRYERTIDRSAMGRWIFRHVLDMGYTDARFSGYDGYMLYKYGSGRGRPRWAERIGKKYQWIALARLAARLADHVKSETESWEPEPLCVPLAYESGRDIDPSFLLKTPPSTTGSAWWFPSDYRFPAPGEVSDRDWVTSYDDLPDAANAIRVRDPKDTEWFVLHAYPEWSARPADADWGTEYRHVWLQLRSYLISGDAVRRCWSWMKNQQFFGRFMPEGAEYHSGFAGEYPWATPYRQYLESYHSRGRLDDRGLPCDMHPTCNELELGHEYDAYQEERMRILVPALRFFETTQLRWDGLSGYLSDHHELQFTDPALLDAGPKALLVNAGFLRAFLTANRLAIVWTVLAEKVIVGARTGRRLPRHAYSKAHLLAERGFRSSAPIVTKL